MKKILTLSAFLIVILLITACSAIKESSTARADFGFIKITGQTANIKVLINDVEQILVLQGKKDKYALLEIPSGNYKIEIFRDGISVLKQKIIVNAPNTTEVRVP